MAGTTSRGRAPIDRGWAWMVCLGFFVYVFFMVGLAKSFGLILVALIREFDVSTATATLPISVTLFVYAFGAPMAILIGHHFTIQKVVIVGAIIGFAGISMSSLLFSMGYFVLTFGLFYGVGNSCFYGNGMMMIGHYFKQRRSLANGLALSGASIGQFCLPPLIEYLLENYGLSGTLLMIGSFYLHGVVSGLLFRPIDEYDPVEEMTTTTTKTVAVAVVVADEEKLIMEADGHGKTDGQEIGFSNGRKGSYDEKKPPLNENDKNTDCMMKGDGNTTRYQMDAGKEYAEFSDDDDDDDLKNEKKWIIGSQGSVFMVSGDSQADDDADNDRNQRSCANSLSKIIDFSLLRNYVTIFFTVVSFLCFFGYFNFVLFLPSIVLEKGIKNYYKAILISISGAGDLIARISIGFFADLNIVPRYKIKAMACLLCGLNICMFVFADSFGWLAVHCFLYGFLGGAYVCMIAVVLVDIVGLPQMGPNLAVVLFIQGIGSSAGNPFLGFLKDETGSFVIVIVMCGLAMVLGAAILFFLPLAKRLEAKRKERIG